MDLLSELLAGMTRVSTTDGNSNPTPQSCGVLDSSTGIWSTPQPHDRKWRGTKTLEVRKGEKMGQLDGAPVDANANANPMAGAGTLKREVAPTMRAVSDEERTALEARKGEKMG